jgi:uncharacterized membrane protein YhaH (DUF805 family)
MSAYHEIFWAFVGTTGPIIALANVITFGDATTAVVKLHDIDRKWTPVLEESRVKSRFFYLLRRGHIYFVGLCFILALTLTTLAGLSLWQQSDIIAGPLVIAFIIITFVLLFILGACSESFKRRLEDTRESQKKEQSKIG